MLNEKRACTREQILGAGVSLLRSGFVDNIMGAALICNQALQIERAKADADGKKRELERLAAVRRDLRSVSLDERRRWKRGQIQGYVDASRAVQASMPVSAYVVLLRSLKTRRAHSRCRVARMAQEKRSQRIAQNTAHVCGGVELAAQSSPLSVLADLACKE